MLIQGKKLPICTRDNKRPAWLLADAQIKAANPELMLETAKQCGYQTLSMICGYVVPLTLIIALLALLKACEWQLSGGMVLGVGAILAGFMGTRWLTQYATRKVSEIEVEKRFI
jgi:hypothetical protein